jgi:hypothetical protein
MPDVAVALALSIMAAIPFPKKYGMLRVDVSQVGIFGSSSTVSRFLDAVEKVDCSLTTPCLISYQGDECDAGSASLAVRQSLTRFARPHSLCPKFVSLLLCAPCRPDSRLTNFLMI